MQNGQSRIDALVSLTASPWWVWPACNDAKAAEGTCWATLDVPYLVAHPVEFQTLDQWAPRTGPAALESTIMVAIPELDGAPVPPSSVAAGRRRCHLHGMRSTLHLHGEWCERICSPARARRHCWPHGDEAGCDAQGRTGQAQVAVVLFIPAQRWQYGTAAHLSVFESRIGHSVRCRQAGYSVDPPDSVTTCVIA